MAHLGSQGGRWKGHVLSMVLPDSELSLAAKEQGTALGKMVKVPAHRELVMGIEG